LARLDTLLRIYEGHVACSGTVGCMNVTRKGAIAYEIGTCDVPAEIGLREHRL